MLRYESISDMIVAKLGKEARKEYDVARKAEDLKAIKFGLEAGLKLRVSVLPHSVEEGFVETLYTKFKNGR